MLNLLLFHPPKRPITRIGNNLIYKHSRLFNKSLIKNNPTSNTLFKNKLLFSTWSSQQQQQQTVEVEENEVLKVNLKGREKEKYLVFENDLKGKVRLVSFLSSLQMFYYSQFLLVEYFLEPVVPIETLNNVPSFFVELYTNPILITMGSFWCLGCVGFAHKYSKSLVSKAYVYPSVGILEITSYNLLGNERNPSYFDTQKVEINKTGNSVTLKDPKNYVPSFVFEDGGTFHSPLGSTITANVSENSENDIINAQEKEKIVNNVVLILRGQYRKLSGSDDGIYLSTKPSKRNRKRDNKN